MRIVLVPALITLAVTLLRLAGELMGWSDRLFSRAPGGGAALVGIVWLIPVFGLYFGLKLCRAGAGPDRAGKAFGFAMLAFAFNSSALIVFWGASPVPVARNTTESVGLTPSSV